MLVWVDRVQGILSRSQLAQPFGRSSHLTYITYDVSCGTGMTELGYGGFGDNSEASCKGVSLLTLRARQVRQPVGYVSGSGVRKGYKIELRDNKRDLRLRSQGRRDQAKLRVMDLPVRDRFPDPDRVSFIDYRRFPGPISSTKGILR